MKISKILAGMSAAAIVASMAMIPASAAGTKLNVSDDLAKIGRQTQDDLFAVFFNGDESEGAVNKDAISDLGAVYGASFTIKVDNNDWNTIGGGGSINFNSKSGGWNAKDWAGGSWVEDDKPKDTLCYTTEEEGTYVLEYLGDAPVFATTDGDADNYAAVGINNWAADLKGIDVVGMKVLGADGNVLFEAGSNKDKKEVQKKPVAEESSSGADSTPSGQILRRTILRRTTSLLQQLHLQQQLAQHLQRLAQQLQQLHLPQQLLTTQQLQAQQLVLHLLA